MVDYASGFSWPLIVVQVILVVMVMRGNRSVVDSTLKAMSVLLVLALLHYLHSKSGHDLPEAHVLIAGVIGIIVLIATLWLNEHFHRDWGNHTQRKVRRCS